MGLLGKPQKVICLVAGPLSGRGEGGKGNLEEKIQAAFNELKNICLFNDMPISILLLSNVILSILYPGFHIKVLGVYTRSMDTIYLSPEGTGSCGYLFHEIPGISNEKCIKIICDI